MMRRVTLALIVLTGGLATLAAEGLHTVLTADTQAGKLARNAALAKDLGLTDPALFTEARYVRHLTQADHFTPFQDAPVAFEHFPSGSLVLPPAHLRRGRAGFLSRPPKMTTQNAGERP